MKRPATAIGLLGLRMGACISERPPSRSPPACLGLRLCELSFENSVGVRQRRLFGLVGVTIEWRVTVLAPQHPTGIVAIAVVKPQQCNAVGGWYVCGIHFPPPSHNWPLYSLSPKASARAFSTARSCCRARPYRAPVRGSRHPAKRSTSLSETLFR